ncbi:hypothetical protein QVD99_000250 [Batrachochytrium dendrobatidis]|nr:hypothetical protein QVD99_000250 [Batrachochytrium dendrobatidis]
MLYNSTVTTSFGDHDRLVLQIFTQISAVIGLLGVFGISYMLIKSSKSFSNPTGRLVTALAVADFIDAASKLVGQAGPNAGIDSAICQIQAAMIQEGTLASIFISLSMTLNAVYIVFFSGSVSVLHKHAWVMIALCFCIPLPLSILPIFYKVDTPSHDINLPPVPTRLYQDAQQWCWIPSELSDYQIYFFYAELFFIFSFNSIAYVLTWIKLRQSQQHVTAKARYTAAQMATQLMARRMLLYTIGFVIAWTPSAINRLTTAFTKQPVFALALLQSIVSPMRGFINFLVFLQTQKQNVAAITQAKQKMLKPSNASTATPQRPVSPTFDIIVLNHAHSFDRTSGSHNMNISLPDLGGGDMFQSNENHDVPVNISPSFHDMARRSMEFNRCPMVLRFGPTHTPADNLMGIFNTPVMSQSSVDSEIIPLRSPLESHFASPCSPMLSMNLHLTSNI